MKDNNIDIIKELKKILNKELNGLVKEVILFGSQLDEMTNQHSDYDILIIVDTEITPKLKDEIISICYETDLKYGILTDTHILSTHDINSLRGKQPVFTEALNNGIRV